MVVFSIAAAIVLGLLSGGVGTHAAAPPLPITGSWSIGGLRLPDAMGTLLRHGEDPLGGSQWW